MPANDSPEHPWIAAQRLEVVRGSYPYPPADLEPGVKFFVLMLEQLGCTTYASCEGHPRGFYVGFSAPEGVARAVCACGFFDVAIVKPPPAWIMREEVPDDRWSLRISERPKGVEWTDGDRVRVLMWAAAAWVEKLGPLEALSLRRIEGRGDGPGPGARRRRARPR